jgi:hypothetical protein
VQPGRSGVFGDAGGRGAGGSRPAAAPVPSSLRARLEHGRVGVLAKNPETYLGLTKRFLLSYASSSGSFFGSALVDWEAVFPPPPNPVIINKESVPCANFACGADEGERLGRG